MRRKLLRWWLKKQGLTIAPIAVAERVAEGPVFAGAMRRLRERNTEFHTVIDVGASTGTWSEDAMRWFPDARYLCVEAQAAHEPGLKDFISRHPNAEYALCAAGARDGEIYFDNTHLLGGVASEAALTGQHIVVPVATIDTMVEQRGLQPPYLIKLDTHGFEIPILDGAAKTLEQTAVLIIEVYNFPINPTALMFPDMVKDLAARGFRCVDSFDPLYRPGDQFLWQMDMVFIRADRPEFERGTYQ